MCICVNTLPPKFQTKDSPLGSIKFRATMKQENWRQKYLHIILPQLLTFQLNFQRNSYSMICLELLFSLCFSVQQSRKCEKVYSESQLRNQYDSCSQLFSSSWNFFFQVLGCCIFCVLCSTTLLFLLRLSVLSGRACESWSCECHLQKLYFQSMLLPRLKKVKISYYIFEISLTQTIGTSVFLLRPASPLSFPPH